MKEEKSLPQVLRDHGYRLTPQRLMVLDTVYRTLELLKDKGLVAETDLGGGRFLYHPVGKAQHHHLVCRKCNGVHDIDIDAMSELRQELLDRHGFSAELEHIAIFGTCANCEG